MGLQFFHILGVQYSEKSNAITDFLTFSRTVRIRGEMVFQAVV